MKRRVCVCVGEGWGGQVIMQKDVGRQSDLW